MQKQNTKMASGHIGDRRHIQAYMAASKPQCKHRLFVSEVSVQKLFKLRLEIGTTRHGVLQAIKNNLRSQLNTEGSRSSAVKDILDQVQEIQVSVTFCPGSDTELNLVKRALQAIATDGGHIVHDNGTVHEIYAPHPLLGATWFEAPVGTEKIFDKLISAQQLQSGALAWNAVAAEFPAAVKIMTDSFSSVPVQLVFQRMTIARRVMGVISVFAQFWHHPKNDLSALSCLVPVLNSMTPHLNIQTQPTLTLLVCRIEQSMLAKIAAPKIQAHAFKV